MKKLMVFGLSLVIFFLFVSLVSAVRINEVELNPEGPNVGNEWIELYSEYNVNLTNWRIMASNGRNMTFNASFSGYYILIGSTNLLTDNNTKLFLTDFNNSIINETVLMSDEKNDNRTWQHCDGNWIFTNSTKGQPNLCQSSQQNQTQNNTQNPTNTSQQNKIYLELNWDEDDIVNGEKFDIEVKAYNLKNENYDIKIYITPEDDSTIISETYNEEDDKWKSSTYYIESIISGSGDKSATLSLRIKSSYRNFSGDAELTAKIRKSEPKNSPAIDEVKEDIEVLENEDTYKNNTITQKTNGTSKTTEENDKKTAQITGEVIKLGNRQAETKDEKENVLYESGSEKIKKYAIYGLNLILIVILIFLLKRKGFKTEFAKE